ncbi:MAG: archaeosortase/exosortase family protein [Chitinophagales bacterium]
MENVWHEKSPIIKLIIKMLAFVSVFYLFFVQDFFQKYVINTLASIYASIGSFILNIFGFDTHANGYGINSPDFSISISTGCDAVEPIALFVIAILSFYYPLSLKLKGILVGVPTLLFLNLFRVLSLFLIGIYIPSIFDMMHYEVWQVLFIMLTILMWLYWVFWGQNQLPQTTNA